MITSSDNVCLRVAGREECSNFYFLGNSNMHRVIEMKRVAWDFQYLVEQLSEEETLQRHGFLRIIVTENSLIRDQWASAMLCAFLPSRELVHENGCWHSFNSVKYMELLSNTRLHLHTSRQDRTHSYDRTWEETTQTKFRDSCSLLSSTSQLRHFITVADFFLPHFHKLTRKSHIFSTYFRRTCALQRKQTSFHSVIF